MALARLWWPNTTSNEPSSTGMLAWLSSQSPQVIYAVTDALQDRWSGGDPKGFAAFLASPDGQHAPRAAFNMVGHHFASRSPQAAIDWASSLPDSTRHLAETAVLTQWQRTQPTEAAAWLEKNPDF